MIRARMAVLALATLLLLGLFTTASAQYRRGYYSPSYSAPYCPPTYNYSYQAPSIWTYRAYPATEYFYRVRYVYEGGKQVLEDDGWLYSYNGSGYTQYAKIVDYLAKPALVLQPASKLFQLGKTDYGYDPVQYAVAKLSPKYAALIQAQGVPNPTDVVAILPPLDTTNIAIQQAAVRSADTSVQHMAAVIGGAQANERLKIEGRNALALQANRQQNIERWLGKIAELEAVAAREAQISSTAYAQQLDIDDPQLAAVIGANCFRCHGGALGVKGNLDFRQARQWDDRRWKTINRAVQGGRMPPEGQPLDDQALDLFEDYYDRIRNSARNERMPPEVAP